MLPCSASAGPFIQRLQKLFMQTVKKSSYSPVMVLQSSLLHGSQTYSRAHIKKNDLLECPGTNLKRTSNFIFISGIYHHSLFCFGEEHSGRPEVHHPPRHLESTERTALKRAQRPWGNTSATIRRVFPASGNRETIPRCEFRNHE